VKKTAVIASAVFLADQATKALLRDWLPLGESVSLLPFFALTHVQNTGAAFGMFAGANGIFIGLTFVILALLAKMHRELAAQGALCRAGIPLLWGGAVGNLADRLRQGSVTDFLDVHWRGWHWPAFNVADSGITVGIALLLAQHVVAGRTK
jgi:signal peptidase II